LLGSGRGADPSPLGLTALIGLKHLGQASSPNFNGLGLQLNQKLLELTFKIGSKLLDIVLQPDPFKLG